MAEDIIQQQGDEVMISEGLKIVFLGDSLTEDGQWAQFFPQYEVYNHGISGDTTAQIYSRLHRVLEEKADIIFLQAGINDLANGVKPERILMNHVEIWQKLKKESLGSKIYVISLLPVLESSYPNLNKKSKALNIELAKEIEAINLLSGRDTSESNTLRLCNTTLGLDLKFIDLYPLLADDTGQLRAEFSYDGIHLKEEAYQVWSKCLLSIILTDN